MYKRIDGKFTKIKQEKSFDKNVNMEELAEINAKAQKRIEELEKIALERWEEIKAQKNYIATFERNIDMSEYAYMPDAQIMVLAKERGVDGRIKDRKIIIDALIEKQ